MSLLVNTIDELSLSIIKNRGFSTMREKITDRVTHILIIETDSYAGNFERELCAYATGLIGECEVGDRQARDFSEEFGEEIAKSFQKISVEFADDNGTRRPCSMRRTPNNAKNYNKETYEFNGKTYEKPCYNDIEIFFNDRPTNEQLQIIVSRTKEFAQTKGIKIFGYKLIRELVKVKERDVKIEWEQLA